MFEHWSLTGLDRVRTAGTVVGTYVEERQAMVASVVA